MNQPPIVQLGVHQIRPDPRKQCRCTVMKHTIVMSTIGPMSDLMRVEHCACAQSRVERMRAEGTA